MLKKGTQVSFQRSGVMRYYGRVHNYHKSFNGVALYVVRTDSPEEGLFFFVEEKDICVEN